MKIALFPLDVVLFPKALLPLHIFEPRYKEMIGACLHTGTGFGITRTQAGGIEAIGCMAEITRVLRRYPDGRLDILCQGTQRFAIEQLDTTGSYLQAEVDFFDDEPLDSSRDDRALLVALHLELLSLRGAGRESYRYDLDSAVSLQLGWELPSDLETKQRLMACRSDGERTGMLLRFYNEVLPQLRMRVAPEQGGTIM